mgnify:FL=1
MMKKAVYALIGAIALATACGASQEVAETTNTQVTVHYRGKEISRKNGRYIGENELKALLSKRGDAVIIFSAEWCNGCKLVRRALEQAKLSVDVHYINIDEPWAQSLATAMGINQVPLMFHVGASDGKEVTRVGAGPIVIYLTIRF